MKLGSFSISLTVKDIAASRAFYEKLGFKMVSGDQSKNWVVLQNETTKIGLFQGMFERNMLTFNPGRDSNKATLADFDDVRDLQKTLKARGLTPTPPPMNPPADRRTSWSPTPTAIRSLLISMWQVRTSERARAPWLDAIFNRSRHNPRP
ncbi:MAG TPA: VOC family protein [Humisphaera sp.]|jgi:hypothetical protein|nr:VOC family protein [Humisphaera sp.]